MTAGIHPDYAKKTVLDAQVVTRREYIARRDGVIYGVCIGAFLALTVAVVVAGSLDLWRQNSHAKLVREAEAKVTERLAECQDIVSRMAGQPYDQVSALKRQIDAVQR